MNPMNLAFGVATIAALSASAAAGVTLSASVGGASSASVVAGDSIAIDIVVAPEANEDFNSAIFRLAFSQEGLSYLSYGWAAPFVTGSIFDQSKPKVPAGMVLDEWTLSGPGYAPGLVDVEFANASFGSFAGGTIVTVLLEVPVATEPGTMLIWVEPDTIADGFQVIESSSGPALELEILPVPAPGSIAVLAILSCVWTRRRR